MIDLAIPTAPPSSPALLAGRWRESMPGCWNVYVGQFSAHLWEDECGWAGLIDIWGTDQNTGPHATLSLAQAACERAAGEYLEGLWAEIREWPVEGENF